MKRSHMFDYPSWQSKTTKWMVFGTSVYKDNCWFHLILVLIKLHLSPDLQLFGGPEKSKHEGSYQ
jgi:hypothetical protein